MTIVKRNLADVQQELAAIFEKVSLKGQGPASFLYVLHKDRAVEISEHNGGFWLEFWEQNDDEDDAPTMTVDTCEQAVQEARKWLAP